MAGISINNKFMRSYKQKHHQFELKGIKTGKNERRLLNSLSSSSRKLELFGCECPLFFKRRGKCLLVKGNLEMNGASALVYTGPMASTQSHELGLLSAGWNGTPAQLLCRGRTTTPLLLALKAEHWTKDDPSWALRSDGIHSTLFWMCLRHITLSLFPTSPLWDGNIYPMPTFHCILIAHSLSGLTG